MRILLINSLYPPHAIGGAERSVALLAEALAASGDDVHVATLDRGEDEKRVVERGVTVHRMPLDNLYWPWTAARRSPARRALWHWRDRSNSAAAARVDGLIERVRPDLVHSQLLTGFSPAVWSVVKARGLPLVHTLRDYSLICARAALFRRGRPCVTRCSDCRLRTAPNRGASRLVDVLAGNSDYLIDAHRRAGRFDGVLGRRMFNVVLPAATQKSRPPNGPLTFGFLGRIEPEKGIEVLLAALSLVDRDAWQLRIGGMGQDRYVQRLRTANADPRIMWFGQVEAGAFYRSIDVLVIPSIWPEPLPRTLVEGVAHGRSIIAADSGGIGEVAGLGRCTKLYRADEPAALASVMRAAIDSPEAWRTGGMSSDDALEPFSARAVVAAHHELYDDALRAMR